jgi:peptide/nickel transport system permease protein
VSSAAQQLAGRSKRIGVRSNLALYVSVGVLVLMVLLAVFGDLVTSRPADLVKLQDKLISPFGTGEDGRYLLGTDALGRDMLSRLIAGARISLFVGVSVVLVSAAVGTLLGLLAAFGGRRVGAVIMRLADAQVAFPGLVFIILLIALLGAGVGLVIAVLSFYGWMIFTRVVRGHSLQLQQAAYFQAAEVTGASRRRLVKLYVLPALVAPLLTQGLLELARIILAEASLSYLGLGIQPPDVSWGVMVAENQRYMATAWWTVLLPGLTITATVLSVNVVANWIVARRGDETIAADDTEAVLDALVVELADAGGADAALVDQAELETETAAASADAPSLATGEEGPVVAGALLSVTDLSVDFRTTDGPVPAVRDVSFHLAPGEVVALVGESGSGKTSTALAVADLLPVNGVVRSGRFAWKGDDVTAEQRVGLRGHQIGYVFQDPARRLNPLISIGGQVAESLRHHLGLSRREAKARAVDLLEQVGIPDPARRYRQLPHQMSGGMAQRVMLAMVLGPEPDLLIADEPTAALDVTVQAQILDLLAALRRDRSLAVLMISHDLGAVASLADRVLIMQGGCIVEQGPAETIFASPRHEYTQALLAATPRIDQDGPPVSSNGTGAGPGRAPVTAGGRP